MYVFFQPLLICPSGTPYSITNFHSPFLLQLRICNFEELFYSFILQMAHLFEEIFLFPANGCSWSSWYLYHDSWTGQGSICLKKQNIFKLSFLHHSFLIYYQALSVQLYKDFLLCCFLFCDWIGRLDIKLIIWSRLTHNFNVILIKIQLWILMDQTSFS